MANELERPEADSSDSYMKRLVTYIPTEVIAAYVAVSGFIKPIEDKHTQFIWFTVVAIFFLVGTPVWIMRMTAGEKRHLRHAFAATLAYAAWVFATGGPFLYEKFKGWYSPQIGAVVLIMVCFCLPLIGTERKD